MKNITTRLVMLLITLSCAALIATSFSACGGGGSGTATEDGVDAAGEDGAGDDIAAGPTTKELIADAMARIAINSALTLGLGIRTDDAELTTSANLEYCGVQGPPPPPGVSPLACDVYMGENSLNCPKDCSCGDGVCDDAEDAASCPADCRCGNGTCDVYGAGEDSTNCPDDCHPVCGDGICAREELYDVTSAKACAADCTWFGGAIIDGAMPRVRGVPTYFCVGSQTRTGGTVYLSEDGNGMLTGQSVCGYGYDDDDANRADVDGIFIDFHIGLTDVPINGITFRCAERTYPGECLEGSAQIVFMPDGTVAFYAALSGKVYALREAAAAKEGEAVAEIIVGAATSGTITLPMAQPHQTCVTADQFIAACPAYYRYPNVSVSYDAADVYYLESDGSVSAPDHEICQSFMIDWTLIAPDWWFGPPDGLDMPFDEDGNGLAGCADPACADHPFCRMSYCDGESTRWGMNFHGAHLHPTCPDYDNGICSEFEDWPYDIYGPDCCGNDICSYHEKSVGILDNYCFADCCGDGICQDIEKMQLGPYYCSTDCPCGDGFCDPLTEDIDNCPQDCDVSGDCPDGVCGWNEANTYADYCAADCCGNGTCESNEGMYSDHYCEADCCPAPAGDGICQGTEQEDSESYCAADCCGDGYCSYEEYFNVPCTADCPACTATNSCCPDGVCDVWENGIYGLCSADCDY